MFTQTPRVVVQDQSMPETLPHPTSILQGMQEERASILSDHSVSSEKQQIFVPTRTPFRMRSYTQNPYHSHRRRVLRGGYIT